jgi:hypothetical protein
LAKKGLQGSGENYHFFLEKSRFFINLNFLVFVEILTAFWGFRPFGHLASFSSAI